MLPALPRVARLSRLTEKDGGTLLTYNVEAQIGGKLAQLGQRLDQRRRQENRRRFFQNFAATVATPDRADHRTFEAVIAF